MTRGAGIAPSPSVVQEAPRGLSVAGGGAQEAASHLSVFNSNSGGVPYFPSPGIDKVRAASMPLAPNQRPVAVNMHERLRLALLLLAVPHTASLATPVLETVALRGAASSSLRVAEGQADSIDSGAYTV